MVDLSAQQTSLDEVDGFQAQVADGSHSGLGRALDGQCELRFLAGGVLKPNGSECSSWTYTCLEHACVQVTSSSFWPSGVLVLESSSTSGTCDDPKLARPAAKSRKNVSIQQIESSQGLVERRRVSCLKHNSVDEQKCFVIPRHSFPASNCKQKHLDGELHTTRRPGEEAVVPGKVGDDPQRVRGL